MKKYLTVSDYFRAFFAFIPIFFLVLFMMVLVTASGNVGDSSSVPQEMDSGSAALISLFISCGLIYFKLWLIAKTREKKCSMIWESENKIKQNNNF